MSLKAKVEAIIYAAEEPITLEQISVLLKDIVLADLVSAKENAAIGEADSAAEALAANSEAQSETEASASEESTLLPELDADSADLEPGPLMPPEAALTDSVPANDEAESAIAEEIPIEETSTGSATLPAELEGEVVPPISESSTEPAPAESATVAAPEATSRKRQPKKTEQEIAEDKAVRTRVREILVELITDYSNEDRGMEIRQVAGGFRMATKPEHHDVVRAFAKSLKPPIRLSLAALETLAVVAYKQPVTGPEITDIRGVESASVLGTLLDRKLITTAGRKQVIGRPMQYKTSKDFLLRFGLNDVNELPSMEEFSQLASDGTIEITPTEPQQSPSLFEPDPEKSEAPGASTEAADTSLSGEAEELGSSISEALTADTQPQPSETAPAQANSQPEPDAEISNIPETGNPVGQR
jgi:segregation and condensation protein B